MDKGTIENQGEGAAFAAVFCGDADAERFRSAFDRLGKRAAVIQTGTIRDAFAWCAEHPVPALVAVDITSLQFPLAELADLAQTAGPGVRIVAIGESESVEFYRSMLQAGIFDYLVSPVTESQIADLVTRAEEGRWLGLPDAGSVRIGQTVAVCGAAGGAGTSTLTSLLGRWFADHAKAQTLLVDYDRRKGDLALMLGAKADNGLAGILTANQLDYRLIERTVLPVEGEGGRNRLKLLAQKPGAETPVDPQLLLQLGAALCELFSVSVWDIPSHRPDGCTELLQNADVSVLVFDYTVSNARALKILLTELGSPQAGQRRFLVANDCRGSVNGKAAKPAITRSQFETFIGEKVDFEIPNAGRALDSSLLDGPLSGTESPDFMAAVEVMGAGILGRRLDAPAYGASGSASLFSRLRGKLALRR